MHRVTLRFHLWRYLCLLFITSWRSGDGETLMLIHDKDYFPLVLIYYTKLLTYKKEFLPLAYVGVKLITIFLRRLYLHMLHWKIEYKAFEFCQEIRQFNLLRANQNCSWAEDNLNFFFIFQRKLGLTFQVKYLHRSQITCNAKSYFLRKK